MFNGSKVFRLDEVEGWINKWLVQRKYRIVILFPLLVLIVLARYIPFLSLLSDPYLLALIASLLITFLLRVEGKFLVALGVILFVPVFALWFLGETDYANSLADILYIFLLSGTLQIFFGTISGEEKRQTQE